uniref:Metalloprotease TIKI homolog n=1 Tax=Meloidogyne floridensis TaxID=298350 RepID=A0A915P120_9BILA
LQVKQLIYCKQLPNSGNLRDILPKELFNRLKDYMQRIHLKLVKHAYLTHRRHSHAHDWEIRRPIWLLFLLFQLGDSPPHLQEINSQIIPTPMLDLYLAQMANEQNKNLISMETVSEQCNPTQLIKLEQIIFAINYTLNYIEWTEKREEELKNKLNLTTATTTINNQSINKLIKHYKCGTLQVGIEQIDNLLVEDILLRRNERMARRTDLLLKENSNKTLFFALGAGHLFGNQSLIEYLKRIGYQIIPIKNKIEQNFQNNFRLLEEKEGIFNELLIPNNLNNKKIIKSTKIEIWQYEDISV